MLLEFAPKRSNQHHVSIWLCYGLALTSNKGDAVHWRPDFRKQAHVNSWSHIYILIRDALPNRHPNDLVAGYLIQYRRDIIQATLPKSPQRTFDNLWQATFFQQTEGKKYS